MREGYVCVARQTSSLGNGETELIENLLVKGVRQCGKTYLLRTYAQDLFESVVYVNLENDRSARADFSGGLDPHSIVRAIEARTGQRIVPGKTLLFIDEIQACEEALTSLKYFCEDAPEYYVAAAGSLLGVAINHQSYSFPVGKTDLIEMTPLDFEEFLWAMGHDQLVDEIRSSFEIMGPLAPSLHEKALALSTVSCCWRNARGGPNVHR